jgi:predicted transcriptional regulator
MIGIRKFEGHKERRARVNVDGRSLGYIFGMKTAVSIPDDVFAGAEKLAHRTKRSRSDIYSAAVQEYVARHSSDAVTEAMNAAIERIDGAGAQTFVALAARNTLEQVEW